MFMGEKLTDFVFDGEELQVDYVETQTVKDGVECDLYCFSGGTEKDLAIVRVKAGFSTPLQRILKDEKTIEGHVAGNAGLAVVQPDGSKTQYDYDDEGSTEAVIVTFGCLIQWTAKTDLTFYEVCYPPYEDGRF